MRRLSLFAVRCSLFAASLVALSLSALRSPLSAEETSARGEQRIAFVSPQSGSQAIGAQWLEITTTIPAVDRVEFLVDGALVGVARSAPYRVAHDFGTSLDPHVVSAKVYSNRYRDVDSASVTTAALGASDELTVDFVEVPLRVRSTKRVNASDLRVRENGVEQTIRDVKAGRAPASFVFVIDRSLSMGDGKLAAALRAVDDARRLLRPDDTVSVVLFNHNVARGRVVRPNESLAAVFGDIEPSGGTSLRDALASLASSRRTYAFAITDGGDRNSITSEEEAIRRVSGTRTVIDAIVLGRASRFLERAAKNTGGRVVNASATTLARSLRDLVIDINSRYTLAYQSEGTAKGWRTIEIRPRRRGIEIVNARKGYFAE